MKSETLLLGSSPYTLGYAFSHPDCRIFESGFFADPVFAGTLSGFAASAGGEYAAVFQRSGDEANGRRDLLRSEVLLADWVLKHDLALFFGVTAIRTQQTADGFRVTYLDAAGLHTEAFSEVIDAREPQRGDIYRLLCRGEQPQTLPAEAAVEPAYAKDTFLLRFALSQPLTPDEAKTEIFPLLPQLLRGRAVCLTGAHRTEPSRRFAPHRAENGAFFVCDRWFGSPEAAFDAGTEAAL